MSTSSIIKIMLLIRYQVYYIIMEDFLTNYCDYKHCINTGWSFIKNSLIAIFIIYDILKPNNFKYQIYLNNMTAYKLGKGN